MIFNQATRPVLPLFAVRMHSVPGGGHVTPLASHVAGARHNALQAAKILHRMAD